MIKAQVAAPDFAATIRRRHKVETTMTAQSVSPRVQQCLVIAALIAFALTSTNLVSSASAADEKEWRDISQPQLRDIWDKMEGKAPPSLEDVTNWTNAKARSWAELKGKVTVIDCWATWCGPCIQQIPKLQAIHEKYSKKGLVILGVHSSNGRDAMAAFIKQKELPYSFCADANRSFYRDLGVRALPSYFIVDRNGKMRVAGANRAKIEDIVKALLEEEAEPADPRALIGKWPKAKVKNIFATNDLRSKQAPKIEVEKWLSTQPDLKDKMTLVTFWATWSDPSRAFIPKLNGWHEKFGKDLTVIAISDEEADAVSDYAKLAGIKYNLAIDTMGKLKTTLGLKGIPHAIIIDSKGIVRWQGFPYSSKDRLTDDVIVRLLKSDPTVAPRRLAADKKPK